MEDVKIFLDYFNDRFYNNGKGRVMVRVIVPMHFVTNENCKEQFLADLKDFIHPATYNKKISAGDKTKNKVSFLKKIMRKIFPSIKNIDKDLDKIKSTDLNRKLREEKGKHIGCEFYLLGEVKDRYDDNGKEVI